MIQKSNCISRKMFIYIYIYSTNMQGCRPE